MSNGLRGFEKTFDGVTVTALPDESANGALVFVESSRVVPGVDASKGFAGGVNAGGYSATPATTRKFVTRPLSTAVGKD